MKKEQNKLIVCYQEGNDKQWGHIKISPKSSFYPFLKEGNNVKARYEKYDEF